MKRFIIPLLLFFIPFTIFSQTVKKVLVIGIDGCRSDALASANTPNIDNLITNGVYSPDALNDDNTISGPGWSAILCGVWSDKHLVTNNDFSGNNYAEFPPITKYIEAHAPELHTVSICHWGPINDWIIQDHADFKFNVSSGEELSNQAASYLTVNDPDFMFLHFDDVDHAGHNYGFSPDVPEYIAAIESIDNLIAPILQAIQTRPDYENEDWLYLLTTDHGGSGTSHGGNSIQEQRVFVIASGNNITPKVISRDSSIVVDAPENCLGDSIELQFDGIDDYVQILDDPLFNFGANQDFTIECRLRTNISADVSIIGNKDWDSGVNKGFIFSFKYPAGPEWKVNIGDGINRADINTGGTIADNQWHTLSVSFDRDGLMKMYQDGLFLAETDISFIEDIDTNEGLFFGTDINNAYNFTGAIAEVRIWNGVIENQVISDWHCNPLEDNHPNYADLIAYWKINEGSGNFIIDESPNSFNGVIDGAEWQSPDSIISYDYTATPRLVDVPVTALTHLCIPIEEDWALEGQTLIDDCMVTSSKTSIANSGFLVFPNPVIDEVRIEILNNPLSNPAKLEVFHSTGAKVYEQDIVSSDFTLDLSNLNVGVYYFLITLEKEVFLKKVVKGF